MKTKNGFLILILSIFIFSGSIVLSGCGGGAGSSSGGTASGSSSSPASTITGQVKGGLTAIAGATVQLYGCTAQTATSCTAVSTPVLTGSSGGFTIVYNPSSANIAYYYLQATLGSIELQAIVPSNIPSGNITINEYSTFVTQEAFDYGQENNLGATVSHIEEVLISNPTSAMPASISGTGSLSAIEPYLVTMADDLAACIDAAYTANPTNPALTGTACTNLESAVTPATTSTAPTTVPGILGNIATTLTTYYNNMTNGIDSNALTTMQNNLYNLLPSNPDFTFMFPSTFAPATAEQQPIGVYIPNTVAAPAPPQNSPAGLTDMYNAGCFQCHTLTYTTQQNHFYPPSTYSTGIKPSAIAVDSSGNAWVANNGNNTITEISSSGTVLGTYPTGKDPSAIAIDASGNIWVLNDYHGTITEISSSGTVLGTYGTYGTYFAYGSSAIAIDPSGNIWGINYYNNTITEIGSSGTVLGTYSTGGHPSAIAIDPSGNIWVIADNDTIIKFSSSGTVLGTYSTGGYPDAIAIDSSGNVWVANYGNGTAGTASGDSNIMELSSSGTVIGTYVAGIYPSAIAVDPSGDISVINGINYYNNTITEIGSSGTVLGTYPTGIKPSAIAVDSSGDVWFTNTYNNTVTELKKINTNTAPATYTFGPGAPYDELDITDGNPPVYTNPYYIAPDLSNIGSYLSPLGIGIAVDVMNSPAFDDIVSLYGINNAQDNAGSGINDFLNGAPLSNKEIQDIDAFLGTLTSGGTPSIDTASGLTIMQSAGCLGCHTINGKPATGFSIPGGVGPDLSTIGDLLNSAGIGLAVGYNGFMSSSGYNGVLSQGLAGELTSNDISIIESYLGGLTGTTGTASYVNAPVYNNSAINAFNISIPAVQESCLLCHYVGGYNGISTNTSSTFYTQTIITAYGNFQAESVDTYDISGTSACPNDTWMLSNFVNNQLCSDQDIFNTLTWSGWSGL